LSYTSQTFRPRRDMLRTLLTLILVACATAVPPRHEIMQGATDLQTSLDSSVTALADGQIERARTQWREAHLSWQQRVGPGLQPHLSHSEHLKLEYGLALVRDAMESEKGDMHKQVKQLKQELTRAMDRLP
jgi:hypothetical protein